MLKYLNYLNDKLNSLNNNKIKITIEELYEIQKLVFTINKLVEKRITPKSYAAKLASYKKFRLKALDEFGIYLDNTPPFSNPTILYTRLDTKLSETGLNKEQKTQFYLWFNIRERLPKQSITNNILDERKFDQLVNDYHDLLSEEEKYAITTKAKNFSFS